MSLATSKIKACIVTNSRPCCFAYSANPKEAASSMSAPRIGNTEAREGMHERHVLTCGLMVSDQMQTVSLLACVFTWQIV